MDKMFVPSLVMKRSQREKLERI